MGIALAVVLVTAILYATSSLLQRAPKMADLILALIEDRRHARLARIEVAEIDRKYEELLAEHH